MPQKIELWFSFLCRRSETQVGTRVCYVKYDDTTSVGVALHLTNTVFIDRALIIVPVMDGKTLS